MNNNNDRDTELDAMLKSLRQTEPSDEMIKRWSNIVPGREKSTKPVSIIRRSFEWGIAAAVGFAAATAVFHQRSDSGNENSHVFADVDATEMRLIAK